MDLISSVANIMTQNVECVEPDQKIIDLKHIYEKPKFHHHIPVTSEGVLVGVVSLIDFMRAIHNATLDDNEEVYHTVKVRDIMTLNPVSVSPGSTIKEVASILSKGEFHSVLVTENKVVKGIVTTADLLKYFLKS